LRIPLQSLVFPHPGLPPGTEPLYGRFREASFHGKSAVLQRGGTLDLLSHFNLFNEGRWRRYTRIGDLFFCLRLKGTVRVRIREGSRIRFDGAISSVLEEEHEIPLGRGKWILSVFLEAMEETVITGGGFLGESEGEQPRADRVSVVICTYNRPEYLVPNLRLLEREMPPLWDAVIVDNGRSLGAGITGGFDSRFRFFPNPNTGGSGGFTRGILETLRAGGRSAALLMDDDVVIEPEALERTASFFSLLKEEYRQHFLAGAMLRLDTPCVQHEAGAVWNGIRVRHLRHNLDLSCRRDMLRGEREIKRRHQYAAWWYCLIPLEARMEEDLPWPFFLNGDDIEYSLRRARGILTLNGISVWHEPFDKKFNPIKQYYFTCRNGLAVNACNGFSLFRSLSLVHLRVGFLLLKGNRTGVSLVLKGLEDFLAGPEYLFTVDSVQLLHDLEAFSLSRQKKLFCRFLHTSVLLCIRYRQMQQQYQQSRPSRTEWEGLVRREQKGEVSC